MIYLGADHAGFSMKESIKKWLIERGESVSDLGTDSDEEVDYPEIAEKLAMMVVEHSGKGILFCRSGQGMAMAANKVPGTRAAIVWLPDVAKETREDTDANIITIPAGYLSDDLARQIILTWLNTPFSSAERHIRRIKSISIIERRHK